MGIYNWFLAGMTIFIFYYVGKAVYYVWWKPKSIERHLKQQGVKGTPYNILYGDVDRFKKMTVEAWSHPLPLLSHQIAPRVSPFIYHNIQTYGKVSFIWIGTTARLIVAEPELMRQILMDKNGHFIRPPRNPLIAIISSGILKLEGEAWDKRRKTITPAFTHDKIQGMLPSFLVSCESLMNRWKECIGEKQSMELDVASEFQSFSSDVIARSAFGSSLEEGRRVFELQREQAELVNRAAVNIYIPGFRFLPTRSNKRTFKIDDEIKSLLRALIHKKEAAIEKGEQGAGDDLLSLLIMRKGKDLTVEDLIDECKLFHFVGQETIANLLTWTLIVLSMHPDWQTKAREEVLRLCGNNTPDFEIINHLKIVSMILHEVLRLYPPVTGTFRHARVATKIGSISVPRGVDIFLPIIFLHHDREYWGENVAEFKPERFAEGVSKATKDNNVMAYYPFGWGPRICLGETFALVEAKLALCMILQNFWFELSPSYTHAPHLILTLQPQHGAPIILHPL